VEELWRKGCKRITVEFFYDVLDLCGKVDPNMAEPVKLQHLWRGLKPSLVEKFWSMKPATTDEFLTEVKRYQEMTSKTRHEEWAMGMLGNQMPPVENGRLDRLEKMLEGLMGAIGTRGTGKPTADGAEENGWSRGAETAGERNGGGRVGRGGGLTRAAGDVPY
jgi:hypothetical protein